VSLIDQPRRRSITRTNTFDIAPIQRPLEVISHFPRANLFPSPVIVSNTISATSNQNISGEAHTYSTAITIVVYHSIFAVVISVVISN
jgi:hypothetical protein